MIRATTPLHSFVFSENPQTLFTEILITYKQSNKIILEKEKTDLTFRSETEAGVTKYIATFKMTQADTKKFMANVPVELQIRVLATTGDALASKKYILKVEDVLNDEVLA